jgi:hypothetical protein
MYQLCVVPMIPAKCIISASQPTQFLVSAPSGEEVLAITSNPHAKVDASELQTLGKENGRGIFGSMAKLLHRGLDLAHKIKPEHIEMARKGLEHLGVGGMVAGAGAKHKKHSRVY